MSVTVRHLNGDSTFLLIFSPKLQPTAADLLSKNGAYSVLIDPWITGSSIINGRWFAQTDRVEEAAISHLSELEEPDVVICSQNKPDHTHKETLLQLRPEGKTIIAAEPGAARAIRSWNHFDSNRVLTLRKYDPKANFGNSLRLYIPPPMSDGVPGEVVVSFIPAKNYVTGLHNAIGITYQAPTKARAIAPMATIDLPKTKYFHLPMSPASMLGSSAQTASPTLPTFPIPSMDSQETVVPIKVYEQHLSQHRPRLSRSSNTASSELLCFPDPPSIRPSLEELKGSHQIPRRKSIPTINIHAEANDQRPHQRNLPTPPDSPYSPARLDETQSINSTTFTPKSSISSLSNASRAQEHTYSHSHSRTLSSSNKPLTINPARPKAISVLYTPHGIPTTDLNSYIQNHLVKLAGALPLTLLLHSFESAQNPWYLGGNIMTGASGGISIARSLMARCWISAHDEPKEKRGVSIKMLKCETMSAGAIRRELASGEDAKTHGWTCDVRVLPCGGELCLSGGERDLLTGSTFDGVRQGLGMEDLALVRRRGSAGAAG